MHSILQDLRIAARGLASAPGFTGGGGGGGGATVAIARATTNSGNGQTAMVATALPMPLRVMVTENGSPVSGRSVAWSTTGGSVTASSSTDGTGIATAQWTLGQTAGPQSANATLSGASGSPVGFTAAASAGPAASVAKAGGDAQSGFVNFALTNPLLARAADQFGNPVSSVSVMWQVMSGTAMVSPASANTGSNGEGQTTVTLGGTAGTIIIQAVSTGLTGSLLSYSRRNRHLELAVEQPAHPQRHAGCHAAGPERRPDPRSQ